MLQVKMFQNLASEATVAEVNKFIKVHGARQVSFTSMGQGSILTAVVLYETRNHKTNSKTGDK
ncbi:hypothetical protein [Lactobacillus acetotolerans]|uniref:hypothetical protein n=1 Tax=Lactobacillus acetotolerans TaxID=1600 RepID=UPI002FDA615C